MYLSALCCVRASLIPIPGGGWHCYCGILFMISPSTGLAVLCTGLASTTVPSSTGSAAAVRVHSVRK